MRKYNSIVDTAVFSSVVPVQTPTWKALLRDRLHVREILHIQDIGASIFGAGYDAMSDLGDDRLAAIIGVRALLESEKHNDKNNQFAIVVDLGTATTIDAWSIKQGYLGGTVDYQAISSTF